MNLLLILLLTCLAAVIFFKTFFRRSPIILGGAQGTETATVQFDSVVPTYGNEADLLELELAPSFEDEWENHKPVLIEEADTVLLLEAEKLIALTEKITASKVDVYGKLQAVVPGFMLLHKTKYYEPVNQFIALTVKSECGIELSEKELAALWD